MYLIIGIKYSDSRERRNKYASRRVYYVQLLQQKLYGNLIAIRRECNALFEINSLGRLVYG